MPVEHHVDPKLLAALAGELSRTSTAALEASHELLAHYSDTGGGPAQRAVDTLIDHAADALRALTDSFADLSDELRTTAPDPTLHRSAGRSAQTVKSLVGPRPGTGHR